MRIRALALAAAVAAGCSDSTGPEIGEGPWLFLQHASPPASVMDALYRGRVVLDSGCFRLDAFPERHTVIWPFGSRVVEVGGALIVLDDRGRYLGRIGGAFGLGGGEVPQEMGLGFLAPALREPAQRRCPGPYWVVGDVVR